MRLFVAVEIPMGTKAHLSRTVSRLKGELPPARWVRPETAHLTLKFLGERPEGDVAALSDLAAPALSGLDPVEVRLGGGGFFPGPQRPRVAWIGGTAEGLELWANAIDEAAEAVGVDRETRPFALHLTLARLDRPWRHEAVSDYLAAVDALALEPFRATEAVLFASRIQAGGAVHSVLHRWPVRVP